MPDPVSAPAPEDLLYFNGINGDTGDYDLPPMSAQDLARFIKGEAKPENLTELRHRSQARGMKHLGVAEGIDPKRLDQTGWGLILPHDADPAVKEALTPLLRLRAAQAGERFRLYEGSDGYRPDESKTAFLARHKVGPGPVDPVKVPYYLLIASDPERVPFRFQSQLDVQFAVGRIHFQSLDDYANYARSVVEAETRPLKLPRQARLFGVANPMDQATNLSARHLVGPLQQRLSTELPDWTFDAVVADGATKARLARSLGGDETPALLFTASHGMDFPLDSPRQLPHQGALLCQDWPGPTHLGPIPQDFYFAGDDLASDANLLGLIAFFFACYGAGTPDLDDFAKQAFKDRARIAPRPFLAGLPTRMLGLPRGGALAVVGHVERAWTYSFRWPRAGTQTEVFRDTLRRLLDGYPVGSALEYFNERYAELSTVLSDELEEIAFGKQFDPYELAGMWTANNDARGYSLIGDPAVRLPVAKATEDSEARGPIPVLGAVPPDQSKPPPEARADLETPAAAEHGAGPAKPLPTPERVAVMGPTTEGLAISTYAADDPADPGRRTLAAQTRIGEKGDLETVVGARYLEHTELLRLHAVMVAETLATRRGH